MPGRSLLPSNDTARQDVPALKSSSWRRGNLQKNEWEISVSDNGIGFEERFPHLIFRPFQRLHHKDEYGGVGMGLEICAKVLEHHNGRITSKNKPGEGTSFTVTLPMKQDKAKT